MEGGERVREREREGESVCMCREKRKDGEQGTHVDGDGRRSLYL